MGGKERSPEEELDGERRQRPFIDELDERAFILKSYQKARAEREAAEGEQQEDQAEPQQP